MSTDSLTDLTSSRRQPVDVVTDTFQPVAERLFDENDSFVISLEEKLSEARMSDTVEVYLSRAIGFGAISGALFGLVGVTIMLVLIQTGVVSTGPLTGIRIPTETLSAIVDVVRAPFLIGSAGLLLATIGFAAVFGSYVAIPYSRAGGRRREINALLPDSVSFMYALSLGGMSQIEIIETMAQADDTYGEVSREFRTILQETRYFDTDYRTAIQKRAANTPSTDMSQFFTDMLSIIDSGGSMTEFLDDKKEIHFRNAKENQEQTLDTLELFSEIYITISIFPLVLLIILIILDMISGSQELLLFATVYALIPGLGLAFLVIVSTVREDEHGNGYLEMDENVRDFEFSRESSALDLGLISQFTGTYRIYDRIASKEGTQVALKVLKRPHVFLRENPYYTLAVTVPGALTFLLAAVLTGAVPVSLGGVVGDPVRSTVVYVYIPLFITCLPLAVFWEWNRRRRYAVLNGLSENLRKLASANATGLTLLEAIQVVADTSPGKLGEEFETLHSKSNYGMHLKESLVVFNNKYHIPRLARTLKLISKAQEISNQIPSVLSTAAKATETQEELERKRKQRALMQVAIIVMTFLTLLGVIAALNAYFLETMAEVTSQTGGSTTGTGQNFGTSIDQNVLSILFFHAVTLQAILSGLVCGYIRDASLTAGVKYTVGLLIVTLGIWVVVA